MARKFLERRGRTKGKWFQFLKQVISNSQRVGKVEKQRLSYRKVNPDNFQLLGNIHSIFPPGFKFRILKNYLTNRYLQNHTPLVKQSTPEGHSVRFTYMVTAATMIVNEGLFEQSYSNLEHLWDHMVQKRMFATGGIGSLPGVEGFGDDYELDPDYNYCETCAAIGSIYWNWELLSHTHQSKFADLLEWQVYNAFIVGMGINGDKYLYKNPLKVRDGEIERQHWFAIPCCPSNISRTLETLVDYIYTVKDGELWIHQFFGNVGMIHDTISITMTSSLPWNGKVNIEINFINNNVIPVNIRIPGWSSHLFSIKLNESEVNINLDADGQHKVIASGLSLYKSSYIKLDLLQKSNIIEIDFDMSIQILYQEPTTISNKGIAAVTRGPLIYCFESHDNPNVDLFNLRIDHSNLEFQYNANQLKGIGQINGKALEGNEIKAIPYYSWGNRGASDMVVMFKD